MAPVYQLITGWEIIKLIIKFMFSVEQALAVCTANLAKRAKARAVAYTLHCSTNGNGVQQTVHGSTIKELIDVFRRDGGNYNFAFITRKDDVKTLRFFNRAVSKKFFSMTRTGKKAK
jgi:hypothetical protein